MGETRVKRDYYEVLGISRDADDATIKRAYRNLAMKYHPDRNPGDAESVERMKEVNEAYAVLADTEKRRLYDAYGHAGLQGYTQEDIFRGVDFSSLFRESGLGELFGFGSFDSFFGRGTPKQGHRKGADLRYDLAITLEEAAFGAEKTVNIPKSEMCPICGGLGAKPEDLAQCDKCKGSGQLVREQRSGYSVFRQIATCDKCRGQGKNIKKPCPECGGKGFMQKTKELKIRIPPGADTGSHVRIAGEGEAGEDLPGDLYVVLQIQKHPLFERHDDDIYLQQDIAFTTAALGGEVKVPGLDGELKVDIPEGTQTGAVFRINGKGIPHLNGHGKGDEYVIAKVVTPTRLSHKGKQLLREFEKLGREHG